MYEELVKRLRNDAREQECLLHVCNSTMNAAEAADAIDALEKQLAETDAIAEHEHCRYIETLGECDGMEPVENRREAACRKGIGNRPNPEQLVEYHIRPFRCCDGTG